MSKESIYLENGKGLLILIDGPKGVGKTTVSTRIQSLLTLNTVLLDSDVYYKEWHKTLNTDLDKAKALLGGNTPQENVYFLEYYQKYITEWLKREKIVIVSMALSKNLCLQYILHYYENSTTILHFVLTADEAILVDRINKQVGRDAKTDIQDIIPDMRFIYSNDNQSIFIDTNKKSPTVIAEAIIEHIRVF